MKTRILIFLTSATCMLLVACSMLDESPTTNPIDRFTQKSERAMRMVQQAASDGASLGIPGAGIVALIATGIGSVLGVYNERRKRTAPLKSAITQIVRSVETAFPDKSEEQKAALASVQDHATKKLVNSIKGTP
jgi:hypothetical protein